MMRAYAILPRRGKLIWCIWSGLIAALPPRRPLLTLSLAYAVMQSCISGDTLYVVGADRELLSFDLTDNLSPLGRSTVSHIDGDFSYISGMFAVPD